MKACCARSDSFLVHARGGGRAATRPLRGRRALLLSRRAIGGQRIRACSRRTSTGSPLMSRRRSRACPPSARSASRRSTTAPSPIRLTVRRSSALLPASGISGSTRAIRSASPRPAARGGNWRSGSSRASRASTCSALIRAASGRTRRPATSRRRMRRPTPRSSPSTIPTKSVPPPARCARRRATVGCAISAWCSASVYGWERPNWFAPPGYGLSEADLAKPNVLLNENHPAAAPGERPREKWSFRRSNYFDFVAAECRKVHENVGLQDMSAFAKFEVSGRGAEAWLNAILTNKIPERARPRRRLTYLPDAARRRARANSR